MCTGFTTEPSNPTTHHILTGYLCSSYLLYLFHLRGGLASVAITPNHPIGLWNMTLPSYLSVCLFTFISSAIPSGSDFMCKGLCHGHSTAACSQTLMWHLILKNKIKNVTKKKSPANICHMSQLRLDMRRRQRDSTPYSCNSLKSHIV